MLLWDQWRSKPDVHDPRTREFADGLLGRLVEIQHESADVDKEMRYYAEAAAEQLTADPYHGIFEILQNADDLGARQLKLALRRGDRNELLALHDGAPVTARDVIALTLAFLSTKRDDARATGRFGIGLKTLNQIGSSLQVHSPPYHFEIDRGVLARCGPSPTIRNLYEGATQETLFRLRLNSDVNVDELAEWISAIDVRHLLFLRSARSIEYINLRTGKATAAARLNARRHDRVTLELRPGARAAAEVTTLSQPGTKRSWTRYTIEYPVPTHQRRSHKRTGDTTPLSIAIPTGDEASVLAAGLPLGVESSLPFSLNAQFDPESSRRSITHRPWNSWLFARLSELASGVALHRFNKDPSSAWRAVPLFSETDHSDQWLDSRLTELASTVQGRVERSVRLEGATLLELAYESSALERVLAERDLEMLEPEYPLLKRRWRGRGGRWREVLSDLGNEVEIDGGDAVSIFDWDEERAGSIRSAKWLVRLIDAVLEDDHEDRLMEARCLMTSTGDRVAPSSGLLLVRRMNPRSLAGRLGLARPIAADYVDRRSPVRVRSWLERTKLLVEAPDASGALEALARRSPEAPLQLDDDALRLLRDALEAVDESRRAVLAPRIGARITVDGYEWVDRKRHPRQVRPASSYLPSRIAKETRGWPQAAAETSGLTWIHARYLDVLPTSRREEAGARRFFVALGAEVVPRLRRVGSFAAPVEFWRTDLPDPQASVLDDSYATHFAADWLSPDLEAVVRDIARQRVDRKRRSRARALFETLDQHWDRFAESTAAQSVYHYYSWKSGPHIPATWLAQMMVAPWLSNKRGRKAAPVGLAIDTELTRLTRGHDSAQYVYELGEADAGSPLVKALGIKGTAPASELIRELASLRDNHGGGVEPGDVRAHYAALAALCRRDGDGAGVGDVTATDLRRAFNTRPGLVATGLGWKTAHDVRLGRPIFGRRRPFVVDSDSVRALWRTLGIAPPSAGDCLDVLDEISTEAGAPSTDDRAIIVDTIRYLGEMAGELRGAVRRRVERTPLRTSRGWDRGGRIFAVEDRALEEALGQVLPVWLPGCAVTTLGAFPAARGVTVLGDDSFAVDRETVGATQASAFTREIYGAALERLRGTLAENEPAMWKDGRWEDLARIALVEAPTLAVSVPGPRKRISLSREVHSEDGRLYFRDEDALGDPQLGGRVIARFFPRESREMVAYAWSHAWRRAEMAGPPAEVLELAASAEKDPLPELEQKGKKVKGKRLFGGGAIASNKQRNEKQRKVVREQRHLKDFDRAVIAEVMITAAADAGGTSSNGSSKKRQQVLVEPPARPTPGPNGKAPIRQWSEEEKERRGFEILAAALKSIDGVQLSDFRALRGIGADSLDNLRRYFELKVHVGALPDEVRLEPSEIERAATARDAYFLAVIGGLEEGTQTEIRIFADPLRTLRWRRATIVRLGGVLTSRALVIRLADAVPDDDGAAAGPAALSAPQS
jgi:hypothetical protein